MHCRCLLENSVQLESRHKHRNFSLTSFQFAFRQWLLVHFSSSTISSISSFLDTGTSPSTVGVRVTPIVNLGISEISATVWRLCSRCLLIQIVFSWPFGWPSSFHFWKSNVSVLSFQWPQWFLVVIVDRLFFSLHFLRLLLTDLGLQSRWRSHTRGSQCPACPYLLECYSVTYAIQCSIAWREWLSWQYDIVNSTFTVYNSSALVPLPSQIAMYQAVSLFVRFSWHTKQNSFSKFNALPASHVSTYRSKKYDHLHESRDGSGRIGSASQSMEKYYSDSNWSQYESVLEVEVSQCPRLSKQCLLHLSNGCMCLFPVLRCCSYAHTS